MNIQRKVFKYNIIIVPVISVLNLSLYLIRSLCGYFHYKTGNVIIISLHRIGDTVFTVPAVRDISLKENKKIKIVCYPESVPIYRICFNEAEYCILEHSHFWFNSRYATSKARRKLAKTQPEVIYDLTGAVTSATLIFNARAKKILGINTELFKNIFDEFVQVRKTPHLIDMYMDATLSDNKSEERKVKLEFNRQYSNEGLILVNPFAGWKAKEWNVNHFLDLSLRLMKDYNVSLIALEGILNSDLIREIENSDIAFKMTKSIDELIQFIRESDVFIGNDSGPVYIAELLGKPTFTIFGPTNPEYSAPIGNNHAHIYKTLNCSPKGNKQYCFTNAGRNGCPAFQCMNLLETEEVYTNVILFLNRNGIKKKLMIN